MADVNFQLNRAGLREIFKSSEMQAALKESADGLASSANSHAHAVSSGGFTKEPYEAYVRTLSGTAVGGVSTSGKRAERHEAKHQTLSSVNH